MTRMLTKADMLEHVPAIPSTPYIPGYRNIIQAWPPGSQFDRYGEILAVIGSWDGGAVRGDILSDGTIIAYTQVPAVPANPGVPAHAIDHGVAEWNSGGSSISPLDGDGAFRFYVGNSPGGVVVGFVTADRSVLPAEQTHAIYVSGSVARVMESGAVVHTFVAPVDETTAFIVRRLAGTVVYQSGDEVYDSAKPIGSEKLYLDASLFLSGDYVDSPELIDGNSGLAIGEVDAVFPALIGRAGSDQLNYVDAAFPAMTGAAVAFPFGSYGYVDALLPPMGGLVTGLLGSQGDVDGTLPAMLGIVANYAYSWVEATFKPMRGYASDFGEEGLYRAASEFEFGDSFTGVAIISETMLSSMRLLSSAKGVSVIREFVYDGLLYQDQATSNQSLSETIGSTVELGSGLSRNASTDYDAAIVAARAPRQYAVNVDTGALSTYDGFEFNAFAATGEYAFAARKDGVYLLRHGDDEGRARIVVVDFGVIHIGAEAQRTIESIYLGIKTDGHITVRLSAGDEAYRYPVQRRGEFMRAVAGKGVRSRAWNVSIEVEDATEINLDMVELQVSASRSRWGRK